jgi:MSHA biogenesis protein MshL
LFDNGASDLSGTSLNLQPGTSPLDSLPSSAFGGTFALALNLNDFNAFIELLDTQGDTHVLSSPRVATVNNQKAVIKVGSDEFFVTGVTSNTVTGTATSTNQNIILTPFFSGIALDVTPQIDDDGQVILHIHPTVSDVRDQRKEVTVGGQTQSLPLAFSEVRESDSVVRARSGQIVVIGGLMKTSTKDEVAQTPFLSDIPLLGQLFTQKRQRQVKTELVILLKPVVVNSPSDWSNLAHDHLDDFRNMEGLGKGDSAH